ncbi:hypothetical protein [Virgibacillus ihumii]|uniref:hypothetical protein n=1 Tax=Virgibacillus ihumii TaxID=2686091 RepID=UPI00157CB9F5|nr:hypothetical protein [Virgibacillus ihumii]
MAYVSLDRLMEVNPALDPNNLQPGMEVLIPELPEYLVSTLSYIYITGTDNDVALINDFAPYSKYDSFLNTTFQVTVLLVN